jgi:hypothetical protein
LATVIGGNGSPGIVIVTEYVALAAATTVVTLPALPNYLAGLTLSNDATTPNTVLDIDVGSACSDDNTTMMVLPTPFKKSVSAWVAGSGNGGLDTGTVAANTWYHVFLIERTDTGNVEVLFSASLTSPTMPTNYTKKRRIGSVLYNASLVIYPFLQVGDFFLWVTPGINITNGGFGVGQGIVGALTPVGVRTIAKVTVYLATPSANVATGTYSIEQSGTTNNAFNLWQGTGLGAGGDFEVLTNLSAQIAFYSSVAAASGLYITTKGYTDYRGK